MPQKRCSRYEHVRYVTHGVGAHPTSNRWTKRTAMVPPVKSLDIILDAASDVVYLSPTDNWLTGSVWVCLYDASAAAVQRAWLQVYGSSTNRWVSKVSDKIYENHAVYLDKVVYLKGMECSSYSSCSADSYSRRSSNRTPRRSQNPNAVGAAHAYSDGQIHATTYGTCVSSRSGGVPPRTNGLITTTSSPYHRPGTSVPNGYPYQIVEQEPEPEDGCCCRYPFRVCLPANLPSSFSCDIGACSYKLLCTVLLFDTVCGICEVSVSKTFRLVSAVNLANYAPLLATHSAFPLRIHDTHEYMCLCCFSCGCIMASLHLEKSGFLLGETIWSHIYLNNQSRRTIRQVRVQLVQKFKFYASSRYEGAPDYKEAMYVVAEVTLAGLKIGPGKTSLKQPLNVPKTETDTIPHHSGPSFEIRHLFRLIIKPGIKLELPVLIGTADRRYVEMYESDEETPL